MTLYIKAALLIGSISLASPAQAAPVKPYATVGQWVVYPDAVGHKCRMEALAPAPRTAYFMSLDWSANSDKANLVLKDVNVRLERSVSARFDVLLGVANKEARRIADVNSKWKSIETYIAVGDGRLSYSMTFGNGGEFINDVRRADALMLDDGFQIVSGFLLDGADVAVGKLRTCSESFLVK